MKENINVELVCATLGVFIFFWCMINFIPFLFGLGEGNNKNPDCKDKMAPIEYVLPGYQFGCFMGSKE